MKKSTRTVGGFEPFGNVLKQDYSQWGPPTLKTNLNGIQLVCNKRAGFLHVVAEKKIYKCNNIK